jgi:hypothetical protein
VGDKTQTQAVTRISFQAVQSLAKMGRLCHQLSELMSGKVGQSFGEIAKAIAKYQEDEKTTGDLEVSMADKVSFWWVSLIREARNPEPQAAFLRVDRPQIDALLAFSELFESTESLLPWNGPGIREALRGLPIDLIGDQTAPKSAISLEEIFYRLRGLGQAFHIAVEEMRRVEV